MEATKTETTNIDTQDLARMLRLYAKVLSGTAKDMEGGLITPEEAYALATRVGDAIANR